MITHTDQTDEALLRGWRAGDRAAGEALFDRHYTCVARFFHNKVSEPGDLIQRTFLACMESAERFRADSSFRTFLLGIATMVLRNHYRERIGPRNHEALEVTSVEDLGQSVSEVLEVHEEERLLLAALRRLPVDLQILLELRYWERLKQRELAEVLALPQTTIKTRLRRSMALLRRHLAELASSPDKLASTLTKLDGWAAQVRDRMI